MLGASRNHLRHEGAENPFVMRLRRLTPLSESDLAVLSSACSPGTDIEGRTDFIIEGKRPDRVRILLDGWACRYKLLPDGRRQITALLLPGDICDLDSLHISKTDTSVATITACRVAAVDLHIFCGLSAERPEIGKMLGWLTAVENAQLTERNACLGRRFAREHLAHLVCELLMRLTLVGQARDNELSVVRTFGTTRGVN